MYIRSIIVENWRGLSTELTDLSPALNLIYGPNESGKSRLVQALRFALFESSTGRSAHKRALETWDNPAGKPRVEIEFELGGEHWHLQKVFLGTGFNTQLRGAGHTLKDEAAESRLSALMGVEPRGRGEIRPEDCGIWSLLWVEQGQSREVPLLNPISQSRLQDQLGAYIGEIAAGDLGLRVLRQAEALRNRFYTATREDETGDLRDARNRVNRLRSELDEARARHQAVAQDAQDLDASRRKEQQLKERIRLAEQALSDVELRQKAAAEAEKALQHSSLQVDRTRLALERSDGELQRARELHDRSSTLNRDIDALERSHAAALAGFNSAREESERAAAQLTGLEEKTAELNRRVSGFRTHQKAAALLTERSRHALRLEEAAALTDRIGTIQEELTTLPSLTARDAENLRELRQRVDQTRARLEGAAASIELRAQQDLTLDGSPVQAGESRTLLVEDEKQIEIAGIATLVIRPGAGELTTLRNNLADCERDLRSALESAGVAGFQEAEQIVQVRRDLETERNRLRKALTQQLPEGRDELEATVRAIDTQLASMDESAAADFDPAELDRAESEAQSLIGQRDALRLLRDEKTAILAHASDACRDLEVDIRSRRELLTGVIEQRSHLPDDATLQEARQADEKIWQESVAARNAAQQTYERLGGGRLELELEQARQALRLLHDEQRHTQKLSMELNARVESAGSAGRYEVVQELESAANLAQIQLARLEREAVAARRLYEVLSTEYRSARERLTQPVLSRIRPYLTELFPGSEVWFDENLNLLGMRDERTEESFAELSGGAREQLSLLVRIGLAEVIGTQEPWPLVLDDVLVNTDAERIRRIQRVLYRAARKMQILLFTCHGPLFDMLGPDRKVELEPNTRRAPL